MLKGIPPAISLDPLKARSEMGHGECRLLADAPFPANSLGEGTVRANGFLVVPLLTDSLQLFELTAANSSLAKLPVNGPRTLNGQIGAGRTQRRACATS